MPLALAITGGLCLYREWYRKRPYPPCTVPVPVASKGGCCYRGRQAGQIALSPASMVGAGQQVEVGGR